MSQFDSHKWNERELKEIEAGKFTNYKAKKLVRPRDYRNYPLLKRKVPKWLWKAQESKKTADINLVSSSINYLQLNNKWPTPQDRLLLKLLSDYYQNKSDKLVKEAYVDPRNLSRYLKRLEEIGYITREREEFYIETKTGKYKTYRRFKNIPTKKGKEYIKKVFGLSKFLF